MSVRIEATKAIDLAIRTEDWAAAAKGALLMTLEVADTSAVYPSSEEYAAKATLFAQLEANQLKRKELNLLSTQNDILHAHLNQISLIQLEMLDAQKTQETRTNNLTEAVNELRNTVVRHG